MKKILLTLILGIFLISLVSATSIGTFKQDNCISLHQICDNCTYVNLTSIKYPNSTIQNINQLMTKIGVDYNYTFCSTSALGYYFYNVCGDKDEVLTCENIEFAITEGGDNFNLAQAIILLGQFGLLALFFGIGMTFKKEKWKLRTFFFIVSLLMGVIFLNSIRIIIGTSSSLATMGSSGLILGIVVLTFMFLYLFIHALIEVFQYFKARKNMKWEISSQ